MMSNPVLRAPGAARGQAIGRIGRRAFVRLFGVLLLAVSTLAAACSDDPTDTERNGRVHITIVGLQAGAANAGSVRITGEGIEPIEEVIPASLTELGPLTVRAGTYHVEYSPPEGYTMAAGNTNVFDVTIVAGETTEVTRTIVLANGTLDISVTGLSAGAVDGGSASVLRTDIGGQTPLVVAVATNGTASTSVVPGNYTVTYTPPAGHALAAGETGIEDAVVPASGSDAVSFAVEVLASTGTLRVSVTGLAAGVASGGGVQITRTGQPQIDEAVPTNGVLDLIVEVGTYSVTYFPPSGHTITAGTNPQNVNVTQGATSSATYTVEESPAPVGIVFHSDWSTATGLTIAALLDQSKTNPWTLAIGSGWGSSPDSQAAIIPSPSPDFPTTNVFRVVIPFDGTDHGPARIIRQANLPVPANGNSLYYRWYASINLPDPLPAGFDALWHPWQDGQASGNSNWEWEVVGRTVGDAIPAGMWRSRIYLKGRSTDRRFFVDLELNTVYRFELRVLRISDVEFDIEALIFEGNSTTPLFDSDDFVSVDGGGVTLGSAGITAPFVDPANLNGLNSGQNDVQLGMLSVGRDILFGYQAAFAVSTSDWIGPYADGK